MFSLASYSDAEYHCVLQSKVLLLNVSKMEPPVFGSSTISIQLDGLKFRINDDDGVTTSKSTIVLFRTDGVALHAALSEITMSSESASDIRRWTKYLGSVIVSLKLERIRLYNQT